MNLTEKIEQVAGRVKDQKDFIEGGASTKSTFVVPFIEALGYDTYDPNEVTPDFSVGGREGDRETVDYALLSDGTPTMLVECKPAEAELAAAEAANLLWALQRTEARVGILTNGIEYHFFSDRQTAGDAPFFEFNLLDYNVLEVEALKRLRKSTLDLETLITRLSDPSPSSRTGDRDRRRERSTSGQKSESESGGKSGVLAVLDTIVGGIVTIVKVVVGGVVIIIGLFVLIEVIDEDGTGTAQDFVERRSEIVETIESDLRAGRFRTAMDTADTYLEHVQDSTLQALRDEAEWAERHEGDAWTACERYVKGRLQAPSQATFPSTVQSQSVSRSYRGDGRFRIRAHMDLGSGGASEHVPFTCVVETEEGRGWSLQSLDIGAR